MMKKTKETVKRVLLSKHQGVDGIVVTVGLCLIALVLCIIAKDSMETFITTLITAITTKAQGILV